eukprot:s394_g17.t1
MVICIVTGRKAKEDHWLGLSQGIVVEISVYDDRGDQQGRAVVQLDWRAIEDGAGEEGQTWKGRFLAIEDGYYRWWVENTYKMKSLPFHFCARQAHRCAVETLYRAPIHVDVFRIVPEDGFLKLSWMTDDLKSQALQVFEPRVGHPGAGEAPPGGPGVGAPGTGMAPEEVKEGEEGIAGLARALGERPKEKAPEPDGDGDQPKKKRPKLKEDAKKGDGLQNVISQRKTPVPAGNALKMKGAADKKKKKRKRDKKSGGRKSPQKRRRDKERQESDDSSEEETDSPSSSDESLFQLAALPQGVDRLHRIHQERPGALANLTLQRFKELLERSTGRGAAAEEVELPPVARAYLSQIYLARNSEGSLGLRNLRELRTLATLVDMIASNDALRALDVALQRMKSIELFVSQGNWNQANLLELVMLEDEQRAWFRQELKAAQQEHKSELRLLHDQFPKRRTPWYPQSQPVAAGERKDGEGKDDNPPANTGAVGKGKKGRGKGKKGKARW